MATTLNTAAIDALLAKLRALLDGDARREALLFVGRRVGVKAESFARDYPPRKEGVQLPYAYTLDGKPSKFKSRKQRAYVAILGKTGKIPRTRTGFLGNSITSDVATDGEGVLVQVGSALKYAPYVIGGADTQNDYLASLGWKSLPAQLDAHVDELREVVIDTLGSYLKGYLSD